jgi:hypothetical protein
MSVAYRGVAQLRPLIDRGTTGRNQQGKTSRCLNLHGRHQEHTGPYYAPRSNRHKKKTNGYQIARNLGINDLNMNCFKGFFDLVMTCMIWFFAQWLNRTFSYFSAAAGRFDYYFKSKMDA